MEKSDIAKQIKTTLEELTKIEAVDRHYRMLVEQEKKLISERDKIEKQLRKELKDVEDLEKLGIKSTFYKILGNQSTQLEKERQEYLQLSLKHTEHLKSLELVQFEVELLEGKLEKLPILKARIEALKVKREQEIMLHSSDLRDQLMAIHTKTINANQHATILNELTKKGQAALMSVRRVGHYFKKASNWGNWDMAGGSGYSDYAKHSAINNAINEAHRANLMLRSFENELRHAGYTVDTLNIGFQSFSGFMDALFDNLITDWIVQRKIKNALHSTESVADRLQVILSTIANDMDDLKDELTELKALRDKILTES